MSITDRLDEIQARADKATEGPMEFIAHARTDVPALVDAVSRALAACESFERAQALYRVEVGQREIIRSVRAEIAAALGEGS